MGPPIAIAQDGRSHTGRALRAGLSGIENRAIN
jgi:hypothetical protein